MSKRLIVAAVCGVTAASFALSALNAPAKGAAPEVTATAPVEVKDARLKFEINATDGDGGIQMFLDADPWKTMSLYDPSGRRLLTLATSGSVGLQGGTEFFMESAEPTFDELPLDELLRRFPAGEYEFRGVSLEGARLQGTAVLTHDLPAGPRLLEPLEGQGLQDPGHTVMRWNPVPPPNGSPIIGYQVLVVQPDTGIAALPKVVLDVMMPPNATEMLVPPGFLQPHTTYEWEVLAIELAGNQTLSSGAFTTGP